MNLTISKEQIINGLQAVQNVVSTRTTLPILSNVLMRAEGERLELATATFDEGLIGHVELDLRLTERGSELFFGKYPAGTQLACVTVTLPERAALPAEEGLR